MSNVRTPARSTFFNKNSAYIESLVSFILDTKPYHSKLTEVIEEYRFNEEMQVTIKERLNWNNYAKSHWLYNRYSNGTVEGQNTKLNRLFSPLFNTTPITVGGKQLIDEFKTWEVTDYIGVPKVYAKKFSSGLGVAEVRLTRDSGKKLPLVQSIDWHHALGGFQFVINQVFRGSDFKPTWLSGVWRIIGDDEPNNGLDVLAEITQKTKELSLDKSNPNSNINIIQGILERLRLEVESYDVNLTFTEFEQFHEVYREIDERLAIIHDGKTLPRTYASLISDIKATPKLAHIDIDEYYRLLLKQTSSLFFGDFTDTSVTQGGLIYVHPFSDEYIKIKNININPFQDVYEEYLVYCYSSKSQRYNVVGLTTGDIGSFIVGQSFESDKISFDSELISHAPTGHSFKLTPANKIAIHPNANLETWNLIKTHPIAFTRPILVSRHYGYITDLDGIDGSVSLLNPFLPDNSTFVLTYMGGNRFEFKNLYSVDYNTIVETDKVFNDGNFGFTIHTGKHPFKIGDEFYLFISNEPARAINDGMFFGYDVDPYDNDNLGNPDKNTSPRLSLLANVLDQTIDPATPATLEHIQFLFDTRFKEYETPLVLDESSIHKRVYRATAIVDRTKPVYTTYKKPMLYGEVDGRVDLNDPDPSLPIKDSIVEYFLDPDEIGVPDLRLYYADTFRVEYSDDGFEYDIHYIKDIKVGEELQHEGVTFTIDPVEGRPFISVIAVEYDKRIYQDPHTNQYIVTGKVIDIVESGDIFSFEVYNPPPLLKEYVHLIADYIPYINMHSMPFFETAAADWEIRILDGHKYEIEGRHTNFQNNGQQLTSNGVFQNIGVDKREGYSINDVGLTLTIVPNAGLHEGEKFIFSTKFEKPSYLVYGTASGFMKPAIVGEWYFNGKIGFKIEKPNFIIFESDNTRLKDSSVMVDYINPNHVNQIYIIRQMRDGRLIVTNDYEGYIGNINEYGVFENVDIRLTVDRNKFGSRDLVRIMITADDHELYHGHDTVILDSHHPAYTANVGNDVNIVKTTDSDIRLSLQTPISLIGELHPTNIPFYDFSITQKRQNPELEVRDNWVPIIKTCYDSKTSIGEFYDTVKLYDFHTATTGERVGSIGAVDPDKLSETMFFNWDERFFGKYLPMNSNANLLTINQGYSDVVKTYIVEDVMIFLRSGPYLEDAATITDLHATITDYCGMQIKQFKREDINATIADGPVDGYLPGYGNNGLDDYTIKSLTPEELAELEDYYDEGQPIEIYSLLAKYNLSDIDRDYILKRWEVYTYDETLANPSSSEPITAAQWRFFWYMLRHGDPSPGHDLVDNFGIPNKGAGFDALSRSTTSLNTNVVDTLDLVQSFTTIQRAGNLTESITEVHLYKSVNNTKPIVTDEYEKFDFDFKFRHPSNTLVVKFETPITSQLKALIWCEGEDEPYDIMFDRDGNNFVYKFTSLVKAKVQLYI